MEEYRFNVHVDGDIYGVKAVFSKASLICELSPTAHVSLRYRPSARQELENAIEFDPELKERFLEGFPILISRRMRNG